MNKVSILMGSDSDLPVMKEACEVMDEFGVSYDVNVLSAHRTPKQTTQHLEAAAKSGTQVVIAAAGGAAHLAGVCAAHFNGPVIGVPIESKSLKGMDSLLSTVQMPPGIPVATVGINAAKNAGLLAIKILATNDKALRVKLNRYMESQTKKVLERNKQLKKLGYKKYLAQNEK